MSIYIHKEKCATLHLKAHHDHLRDDRNRSSVLSVIGRNLGIIAQCLFNKVIRVSLCTKKRRLLICKHAVFTYVQNTVHKGEHCLVKWLLTLPGHNFVNNGPNLTILVPIDSQDQGLLIGTKMVKIGPLLTKLWDQQVGNQLWFPTC